MVGVESHTMVLVSDGNKKIGVHSRFFGVLLKTIPWGVISGEISLWLGLGFCVGIASNAVGGLVWGQAGRSGHGGFVQ